MRQDEETVVIEPPGAPSACVIWLHGLGADGHDFEPVVAQLGAGFVHRTRFVFPHAPVRPVTINGGYPMRAWYDIADAELDRSVDESGIRASARVVEDCIESQMEGGVPERRIVLAGFSQGAAIVLHAALRHPRPLGGVMALSGYLPLAASLPGEAHAANRSLPVFMAHGSGDPVVPVRHAEESRDLLRDLGYTVEWHLYRMPHAVCPEEIADIRAWLAGVLA